MLVGEMDPPRISDIESALLIHTQIEQWWIENVDISVNPEFSDKTFEIEDFFPMQVMVKSLLVQLATADVSKAQEFYDSMIAEFRKN